MIGARPPRVSVEQVRQIMQDPPDFIAMSYLPAWRAGRFSTEVLAYGVVAALGRSAYDDELVVEVAGILSGLGYGDVVAAVWV